MSSSRAIRRLSSLRWLAPWLTLGVIVVLPMLLPTYSRLADARGDRPAEVAKAVDNAPALIADKWAGVKVEMPPAATQLLQPNAILSRRYSHMGDPLAVELLVVHCTDARDMRGHYPPICYPSSGWRADGSHDGTLKLNCGTVPAQFYVFKRTDGRGVERGLRVLNLFVLPDGRVTVKQEDIVERAARRAVAVLGVTQIQVVASTSVKEERLTLAAQEILNGMPNLQQAIGLCGDKSNE